jgi:sulfatase modifying factor 1
MYPFLALLGLMFLTWNAATRASCAEGRRRFALTIALLGWLALLTPGMPAAAETGQAFAAERRTSRAPMAWIQDGTFMMGSGDALSKATPEHRVYLYAFYIDRYEVTTAHYAEFLEAMGQVRAGYLPMFWDEINLTSDGERPVVGVSWKAAEAYCGSVGKRLPTEAEWEKAARGTDSRRYPWGNELPTIKSANYDNPFSGGRFSDSLRPVDAYETGLSPYGVYGMAGNVSEWVADWYDEKYYAVSPESNPQGPIRGRQKVFRGGSFADSAAQLKATSRDSYYPEDKGPFVGIRCARDASGVDPLQP